MIVHLPKWANFDAWLVHGEDEVGQTLVLGNIPICSRHQHGEIRVMGTGVPDLLPVDDPLISIKFSPRDQPRQIRSCGRLAEELTPDLLAGQDWMEKSFPKQIRPVSEDGGCRKRDCAADGDPHRTGREKLSSYDVIHPGRKALTMPALWP